MNQLAHPRCVESQISTQQVGSELLVYDERRGKAFCLNATSFAVWKLSDGTRTVAQIAAAVRLEGDAALTAEHVLLAIDQLHADGLIAGGTHWQPIPDLSRRQMMQRLAVGAAVLLPGVSAVMAPTAAHAYNGCADCDFKPSKPHSAANPAATSTRSPSSDLYFVVPPDPSNSTDEVRKKREQNGEIFVP